MSAPIRFLGFAILAYVGLRTASSALALEPAALDQSPEAAGSGTRLELPPGVPADMGPAPAAGPYAYGPPHGAAYPYPGPYAYPVAYAPSPYPAVAAGGGMPYPVMMMPPRAPRPVYYAVPYPVPTAVAAAPARLPFEPSPASSYTGLAAAEGYAQPVAPIDQWPAIGTAGPLSLAGATQVTPAWGGRRQAGESPIRSAAAERWSVDGWAMLRPPREGVYRLDEAGSDLNPGLASAGSLGGSQAGARISWTPLASLGVHLRASTALIPKGRSAQNQQMVGGEGSLGVSWKPLKTVPVRLLAERRQRLGSALGGGRNAFALTAEGGLYQQPLAYGINLDGYAQAGVVGAHRRDLFADGALTATYPFMPRFAVGGGMWGGIQPGLSRFDAGPRLSYQLRPGLRAHLDYRFRVTGNADPRSGPAFTLAAGF